MEIFEKIKEERVRLAFTQEQFATAIGATRRSVINWECGDAQPPAQILSAMAASGADVLYILTGKRSKTVAEMALLPPDERGLVDSYRRCNAAAKRTLIQTAALLATGGAPEPRISQKAGKGSIQAGTLNIKGGVKF